MINKDLDRYLTPIEIETEFGINRSTLRKYSLMIDKMAKESYFDTKIINNIATRIYAINEIEMIQEVYRLSKHKKIGLKTAIASVFFEDDTQDNDKNRGIDTLNKFSNNDVQSIRSILESQNNVIDKQSKMVQTQSAEIKELLQRIDDLTKILVDSQIESKKSIFNKMFKK